MANNQSSFKYFLIAVIALLCAPNIAFADLVAYWTFHDYDSATLLSAIPTWPPLISSALRRRRCRTPLPTKAPAPPWPSWA